MFQPEDTFSDIYICTGYHTNKHMSTFLQLHMPVFKNKSNVWFIASIQDRWDEIYIISMRNKSLEILFVIYLTHFSHLFSKICTWFQILIVTFSIPYISFTRSFHLELLKLSSFNQFLVICLINATLIIKNKYISFFLMFSGSFPSNKTNGFLLTEMPKIFDSSLTESSQKPT